MLSININKGIFFTCLIFGPMISAISFVFSSLIIVLLSGDSVLITRWLDSGQTLIYWTVFFSYFFVIASIFNNFTATLPILIYSLLLSISIKPYLSCISNYGLNNNIKVISIICLSILYGVSIYGFFICTGSAFFIKNALNILYSVVIPTSSILGLWFGFLEVDKKP